MKLLKTALIGAMVLAAPIANAGGPSNVDRGPLIRTSETNLECNAEAAAFSEVADLAYSFRDRGDVFADALFELREQLRDCLPAASDDGYESSPPWLGEQGRPRGVREALKECLPSRILVNQPFH
jgi:hypothetical protein